MGKSNGQAGESNRQTRAISRGAGLGLVLFGAFVLVAGLLWALGQAAGLETAPAFFLAACGAPVLVAAVVLIWFFSLPLARRQAMLGVSGDKTPSNDDPA